MMLIFAGTSFLAGPLYNRVGARLVTGAGGIAYMGKVAGGSIGLGLNTAIVLSASSLEEGIRIAFFVDAALALVATAVVLTSIHGEGTTYHRHLHLHHRAHG